MSTEMSDRVVNVRVSVWSGSDDHAKHAVYWALSGGGIVFRDDEIWQLDEILCAVAEKTTITDEMRGWASDLVRQGFESSDAGQVLDMEIERKNK